MKLAIFFVLMLALLSSAFRLQSRMESNNQAQNMVQDPDDCELCAQNCSCGSCTTACVGNPTGEIICNIFHSSYCF